MILVDTSVWVEFLKGHQPYPDKMKKMLEDRQVLAVEPVFGELLQGARDDRERRVLLDFWENLPKNRILEDWVKAGELSSKNKWLNHGIGLIDAILIFYARETGSKVWTLDKKLKMVLHKNENFE